MIRLFSQFNKLLLLKKNIGEILKKNSHGNIFREFSKFGKKSHFLLYFAILQNKNCQNLHFLRHRESVIKVLSL